MGISGKLWFVGYVGVKNGEDAPIQAGTQIGGYPVPTEFHVPGYDFGSP